MHRFLSKAATILAAAVFAFALAACEAPSDADGLAGKYKTEDTQGQSMEITLLEDGTAAGIHGNESLEGSWKQEGDTAVITWDDGWTTKIAKDGDSYKKSASKDGEAVGETISAEKVE